MASDDRRRANLRAALAALRIKQDEPELRLIHRLLDNWTGVGLITVGVERQGFRLSLSHIAEGEWRAQFVTAPLTAPTGYVVAGTPWKAVQLPAWAPVSRDHRQ